MTRIGSPPGQGVGEEVGDRACDERNDQLDPRPDERHEQREEREREDEVDAELGRVGDRAAGERAGERRRVPGDEQAQLRAEQEGERPLLAGRDDPERLVGEEVRGGRSPPAPERIWRPSASP